MKNILTVLAAGSMFTAIFAAPALSQPTLQDLSDRLKLAEIATQIEQAVDRKDWQRARSFFADQVRVDFTSLIGGEPATIPAQALVDGWAANLKGNKESLHMRGTPIITINGQSATAISNGYAYNKMSGAPDGSGDLWEVWGNYTHTFTRTNAGWKVSGFTFDKTHERGSSWVKSTPGS